MKSPDKTEFKNDIFFGDVMFIWPLNFSHVYMCVFYFLVHTQKVETAHFKHMSDITSVQ